MHELKHDGYRLQIHVRDGRARLYTMNGADWSKRYPLIVEADARIEVAAILDAEVVYGVADFDALHSRVNDHSAIACAFDLLTLDGDDLRKKPFSERKAALRKVLKPARRGIQYVEHTEGDVAEMFEAQVWCRRHRFKKDKCAPGTPCGDRERPAEAEDRAVPGHWEGDLLSGANKESGQMQPAAEGGRR